MEGSVKGLLVQALQVRSYQLSGVVQKIVSVQKLQSLYKNYERLLELALSEKSGQGKEPRLLVASAPSSGSISYQLLLFFGKLLHLT